MRVLTTRNPSRRYVEDKDASNNFSFKCHRRDQSPTSKDQSLVFSVNDISFHPVHGTFSTCGTSHSPSAIRDTHLPPLLRTANSCAHRIRRDDQLLGQGRAHAPQMCVTVFLPPAPNVLTYPCPPFASHRPPLLALFLAPRSPPSPPSPARNLRAYPPRPASADCPSPFSRLSPDRPFLSSPHLLSVLLSWHTAFDPAPGPVPCTAFNRQGTIFAYAVSYDWSKGHSGMTPGHPNKLMLHACKDDEVKRKPQKR